MPLEKLTKMLLSKEGATEDYPFGPDTMVVRVKKKMFALVGNDETPLRLNLKCDPDDAQILRSMYPAITPGYHMNKEHWNSVLLDGSVPDNVLEKMIDDSYRLIVSKLKKTDRESLLL